MWVVVSVCVLDSVCSMVMLLWWFNSVVVDGCFVYLLQVLFIIINVLFCSVVVICLILVSVIVLLVGLDGEYRNISLVLLFNVVVIIVLMLVFSVLLWLISGILISGVFCSCVYIVYMLNIGGVVIIVLWFGLYRVCISRLMVLLLLCLISNCLGVQLYRVVSCLCNVVGCGFGQCCVLLVMLVGLVYVDLLVLSYILFISVLLCVDEQFVNVCRLLCISDRMEVVFMWLFLCVVLLCFCVCLGFWCG